ncbi:hypothetical protein ACB092_11G162600, partial [Castanea dentata]
MLCSYTESEFIEGVIKEISRTKSNHEPLFVAKHPVGIDIRAEAIELLLNMESNDVCMVGIYGLGGVGKTTISKAVYNRIKNLFEGSCFLEDVREMSKINSDKILLQKTLLSKILHRTDLNVYNVSEGTNLIMQRLHGKKVLLILDDVGDLKEVENLLGKYNWFAPGSRVIITTRNKQVLTSLGIDHRRIHKVEELRQCEARELFIRHAFQASKYGEDYSELVEHIICYANGLPLALKIIGSDLCGKNIHEWKSALEKYKNIPHKDIQEILKISYDGLENFEKEIFLDIACFFNSYNKDDVVNVLDSCKLYPDYGIGKLIDKCLITLRYNFRPGYDSLSMHDLVQQMGREIVQQESEEFQQRSRIWRYEDAHKLLTGNMGSNKIRSIMLLSPDRTEVSLKANVFKRMKNLKFLVGNVQFGEALDYLPELRFLEWRESPLSLSSKCCLPRQLVVLKMSKSNIILENVVKQGFQYENWKTISLRSCEFITKLPDLSCPNLEELDLLGCENLIEIHESIGFLEKLKVWNLGGCSQLQILPSTLKLKSLEYFGLLDCSMLEKFPDIHPKMNCLIELSLMSCGIRELPSSLLYLTRLHRLCLSYSKLTNFPVGANKSQMQEEEDIPSAKLRLACNSFNNFSGPTGFQNVTFLMLSGCPGIKGGLDSWMQPDYFPVLTYLCLSYTGIDTIPESISRFTTLQLLDIQGCKKLRHIPRLPQSIRTVDAQNCYQLDTQSRSRLLNQFGEIIGILPNTIAQAATFSVVDGYLILPAIEIPEWLKFSHHRSVGNSVSFLVGPKFSNLVVCIAIPSKYNIGYTWEFDIFINGEKQFTRCMCGAIGNYDHVWLTYGEVYISNPSEENRIELK